MAKVRQDAWSHEDDLLLAETVLRHIREGSTQLRAFEEVGDKLNRTAAACGFRWNAEVRRRYDKAIEIAKRQRKEKKRAIAQQQKLNNTPTVPTYNLVNREKKTIPTETRHQQPVSSRNVSSIDDIIASLKQFKSEYETTYKSHSMMNQIEQENESLKEENERLEKKLARVEKQYETMQEDYHVLMNIMDRARKMVVLDDEEQMSAKAFRMEKNGNLQQVAR
ncbi:prespore-specific regulator [Salirhabdus euzebyi]|uniref:Prespore-specific regulator n=1 Tax=Salirhabdus euzebyi TaxID=394506 RepID=A0A841Q199_9BACI|nr:RsfA family transcriptional regulator [Salirhabdus euzebyi]MBB6451873.1 prespore-specific regulator [Salirhabdus euzebyi]